MSFAVAAGMDPRPQLADLLGRTKSMTGSKTVSLICKGSRANLARRGAATQARPVSRTKRTGLQGSSSASSIRALADLAVLADCRGAYVPVPCVP